MAIPVSVPLSRADARKLRAGLKRRVADLANTVGNDHLGDRLSCEGAVTDDGNALGDHDSSALTEVLKQNAVLNNKLIIS